MSAVAADDSSRFWSAFGFALLAHVMVFWFMPAFEPAPIRERLATTIELVEPPAPEPESAPEPKPEPEPEKVVENKVGVTKPPPAPTKPARRPRSNTPPSEAPPAKAETPQEPISFDNVTLNSNSGNWKIAPSSGKSVGGPIREAKRGGSPNGVKGGTGSGGPRFVPFGQLSRKADIPQSVRDKIRRELQQKFPQEARAMGVTGSALIQFQINPDGKGSKFIVKRASRPDFARVCKSVLRNKRYSPGLDHSGQKVATNVKFTCNFQTDG